jgi:hypothetical protein
MTTPNNTTIMPMSPPPTAYTVVSVNSGCVDRYKDVCCDVLKVSVVMGVSVGPDDDGDLLLVVLGVVVDGEGVSFVIVILDGKMYS